ncbi:MAM and LDL-receptor class A domain-containing protein 1-like [Ruditapes philippinarum]|uniref:MAM and LDL-receptor class A domain-containing protein 1-like n=1 Tax=Ruditapes philippinarum TaxID=129788 RepID=UPI00295B4398|nr:MAM and LDL-receptor class A domain-containing protein 1-like [Ruditapes philippinarum]
MPTILLSMIYIGLLSGTILLLTSSVNGFLVNNHLPQPYVCNFEQSQCGFNGSVSMHGMEWARLNVALGHTFLDTDNTFHTKGQGYVMFANGKDSTHSGDIVKFESKPLKFPPRSHISVGFSYIFSEAHTHPMTLSVYLTSGGQSHTPNWVKTGHLSSLRPRWHRVCLGTSIVSDDVTVVFEAKVSYNSNNGNLAIDDVVIEPGTSCHLYNHLSTPPPSITTTTHSSANVSSVTCNFDLPSICGYLNRNSGDNFNWLRHQMATQSVGTGPNSDHSSGRGFYMYIETSSPRVKGDIARIESPSFTAAGHQRLTFWYNVYGRTIGSLKVYLDTNDVLGSPVFVQSQGTNTSTWQRECIQITKMSSNMKIVFEGVVGSGYQGDIAIDDVILDHGDCKNDVDPTIPTVTLNFGHWLSWGSWSSCSHTCGVSTKHRTRQCSSTICDAGQNSQTLLCHTNTCPDSGHWLEWGSWSSCSHTCGFSTSHRTRNCSSSTCSAGQSHQTLLCHMNACSVNGGWSHWSTWSKCSTSCDLGTLTRARSCTNPVPAHGGAQCSGNKTETHECSVGPCPSWSLWYNGQCSSSCGNGTMERIRTCSSGTNSDCPGDGKQLIPCVGTECI